MPQYLSPGVYVEEVASAVQAIAGVGTSTAGFVGIAPAEITIPLEEVPEANKVLNQSLDFSGATNNGKTVVLPNYPVDTTAGAFSIEVLDSAGTAVPGNAGSLTNDHDQRKSFLTLEAAPPAGGQVNASYTVLSDQVSDEVIRIADGKRKRFSLKHYPVVPSTSTSDVEVKDAAGGAVTLTAVTIANDKDLGLAFVEIDPAPDAGSTITVKYRRMLARFFSPEVGGPPRLCTNFSEFARRFGGFSTDTQYRNLTHAAYGFFNNGGTRCFVACVDGEAKLDDALTKLAAVDEVALVLAPGLTSAVVRDKLVTHCKVATQDRFAILDGTKDIGGDPTAENIQPPPNSDYAAFYFPWLKVFDPATKTLVPEGDGMISVPPSGHMAGIYARVDVNRGVHKAPANEVVFGALGLQYQISKAQQDGLNPQGINCIRELNGNIKVWGARTIGGNANGEWRYINVRRSMLFLRESIDEGLQWAVFEPNDLNLWAKIKRNVEAFLGIQWRAGMLFGSTAQEAFYVKCDAETNPPELREIGQVVTEIGVAIVRPAEFVIFRISQWQPPQRS